MKQEERPSSVAEWLTVLIVLVVLAGIAMPFKSGVSTRAPQTRALANAKQIGLACKLFAGDYDGKFPTNLLGPDQKVTDTPPSSANETLAQLIPEYIPDEKIFWLPLDRGYCNAQEPDGAVPWLGAGENHWGYITNLDEKSDSRFPLIVDSTVAGGLTYSASQEIGGGTWKGRKAIVIHVDGSGGIENIDPKTMAVPGPSSEVPNVLQPGKNWLVPKNKFLNPIPKARIPSTEAL